MPKCKQCGQSVGQSTRARLIHILQVHPDMALQKLVAGVEHKAEGNPLMNPEACRALGVSAAQWFKNELARPGGAARLAAEVAKALLE
jgi:hypothetical protein